MAFDLLNTDSNIHDTQSVINAPSSGLAPDGANDWSVSMRRLVGGLSDGVDVITLNNGHLAIEILPTRGMGIWRGQAGGVPLKWNSPVERPVHPAFVDQNRRGGLGWLDGFNELICRCGLGWHGAPGTDIIRHEDGSVASEQFLPLHGRIANLPAHRVSVDVPDQQDGELVVTGVVDEASVFGGRLRLTSRLSTRIGSSEFEIMDTVTNLGSSVSEVEMLYHCNFGEPFLGAESVFHSAAREVAPRNDRAAEGISMWNLYEGPQRGYAEQVYFLDPAGDSRGWGHAVLSDAEASCALSLRFDTSTLPWLALWKNTQAIEDGYCTGIEPCSSFPNLRSFERSHGRVIQLASEQSITFRLRFEVATTRQRTRELIDEVTGLQVQTPRTVHARPNPEWAS